MKGEALSTDIGPASSGHPSPRVVVGVPASEPPPESIETPPPVVLEAKGPNTTRSISSTLVRGSIVDREADLPPPPSEPPVDEPIARVEPSAPEMPSAVDVGWTAPPPAVETPVAAAPEPEPVPEPAPTPKIDLTATVVQGSSEAEKVEAKPEPAPEPPAAPAPEPEKPAFAKTLAFGSKLNELPQSERIETARDRREKLKEKRAHAQELQKAVSPKEDPDEISVPPANDLNVEDERFFDEAEVAVRKSVHEFEMLARQEAEEAVPEKARRKLDPHVIRRRERFVGYVKVAVAGAAIVCLAAVGRSALHSRSAAKAAPIAVAPETPAVVEPVAPKAAEPAAAAQPPPAEAKPAEPAPAESAAPAAAPAESAAAEPAPSKAEEIAGDAKEELKKSRTALEKRKLVEAIEAGERSVALDPTDGEAWLILGAAYQEKGDMVNARRCYGSCVKQGKSGPRLECQKMLRF